MPDDISAATLATLNQLLPQLLETPDLEAEHENAYEDMMSELVTMTKTFEDRTKRIFQPRPDTRYFDACSIAGGGRINGRELLLDHELYELTSITNGDDSVITSGQYALMPRSGPPYTSILLTPGGISWRGGVNGEVQQVIRITGVWVGGKPHSGQWVTVDTLNGDVGAGDRSITPLWLENTDPFGSVPRFSRGQLLRIITNGVSEYMVDMEDDATTKVVRVRRSERGTTAIEHKDGDPIQVWRVDPRVSHAVARGAAYMFQRRGFFNTSEYDPINQVTNRFKGVLPADVEEVIAEYKMNPTTLYIGAV